MNTGYSEVPHEMLRRWAENCRHTATRQEIIAVLPACERRKIAPPKPRRPGRPGYGDELWARVYAHWVVSGSFRATAHHFKLPVDTVKTRARREGWAR